MEIVALDGESTAGAEVRGSRVGREPKRVRWFLLVERWGSEGRHGVTGRMNEKGGNRGVRKRGRVC